MIGSGSTSTRGVPARRGGGSRLTDTDGNRKIIAEKGFGKVLVRVSIRSNDPPALLSRLRLRSPRFFELRFVAGTAVGSGGLT